MALAVFPIPPEWEKLAVANQKAEIGAKYKIREKRVSKDRPAVRVVARCLTSVKIQSS